ncbi:hypothetical protein F5Y06DRAFT_270059 [Hypoxylon sp. FL0890]|nr:hypothetical protein F5Y06DRAFT_270059 [Hypoxylon sp. FL0890]
MRTKLALRSLTLTALSTILSAMLLVVMPPRCLIGLILWQYLRICGMGDARQHACSHQHKARELKGYRKKADIMQYYCDKRYMATKSTKIQGKT